MFFNKSKAKEMRVGDMRGSMPRESQNHRDYDFDDELDDDDITDNYDEYDDEPRPSPKKRREPLRRNEDKEPPARNEPPRRRPPQNGAPREGGQPRREGRPEGARPVVNRSNSAPGPNNHSTLQSRGREPGREIGAPVAGQMQNAHPQNQNSPRNANVAKPQSGPRQVNHIPPQPTETFVQEEVAAQEPFTSTESSVQSSFAPQADNNAQTQSLIQEPQTQPISGQTSDGPSSSNKLYTQEEFEAELSKRLQEQEAKQSSAANTTLEEERIRAIIREEMYSFFAEMKRLALVDTSRKTTVHAQKQETDYDTVEVIIPNVNTNGQGSIVNNSHESGVFSAEKPQSDAQTQNTANSDTALQEDSVRPKKSYDFSASEILRSLK